MDVHNPEQRRRNMQAIRAKETRDEVILAKALWHRGHRYRKNDTTVFGKPDLTFKKRKLAIFVDGEFFHGRNWKTEKYRIKSRRDFWWPKIEGNMKRDKKVNKILVENGWKVLRFWSRDVRTKLSSCISKIEDNLRSDG